MIIGTAGHIDHGKTALVKALTGVDTDRLKEEKARGISIELGYAYTSLANGEVLGFVDVPGHERFIHTMLAGAAGIDFALLVVAADDGPMPQTHEHLQLLRLLGVTRGAVALTKNDLVDAARTAEVAAQLQELGAPLFPDGRVFCVSSKTGEGIAALALHLEAEARKFQRRGCGAHFRLAVDRSFTLKGAGTVVTGTVFSGQVRVGQKLLIAPAGQEVRVRSIHAQNRPAEAGRAGERCALNLVGAQLSKDDIARGDWVLDRVLHFPVERLDARFELSSTEAKPLKHWIPVHLHLAAAHVTGRVALLESERIEPGAGGFVQLVLASPIATLAGDRFVLRDQSASRTLGGGTVLDIFPPTRYRRTTTRLAALGCLAGETPRDALRGLIELSPEGVDLARFALVRNLKLEELDLQAAEFRRVRTPDGDYGFATGRWRGLAEETLSALAAFHESFPDLLGPDLQRLRRMAYPRLPSGAIAALVAELIAAGRVKKSGPWLHLPEHSIALSPNEESLAQKILPVLEEAAFDPPWIRDIAHTVQVEEISARLLMQRLARQGEVYRVVRDLFYSRRAVAELAAIASRLEREHGEIRAAAFRDAAGIGRKRAVQLLEFFDRIGYTRRARDVHRLRSDSLLELTDLSAQTHAGATS
jgi:selenocysteine-specific elongation factor